MVKKIVRLLPYLLCFVGTYYLLIEMVDPLFHPSALELKEYIKWINYAYAFTTLISFTFIGEAILRFQNGVRRMRKEEADFILPIFNEVLSNARRKYPRLRRDICLYVSDSAYMNAYAIGKKSVVLTTEALLYASPEEIEGLLAHELGHIYHKHTSISLLMYVGNIGIMALRLMVELFNLMVTFFAAILGVVVGNVAIDLARLLNTLIRFIFCTLLIGLWEKVCGLLCNASNRSFEYEADEFAFDLGYGQGLVEFLNHTLDHEPSGLFSTIAFSHPKSRKRIVRLSKQVYA